MKRSDGGGKILGTFFFISEHGVLLTTSLADSPCQSLDENRPFYKIWFYSTLPVHYWGITGISRWLKNLQDQILF